MSTSTMKRGRSISCSARDQTRAQELPKLRGQIILQVFTHKSLQQHVDSGNNERLAELGQQILQMAITHTLFQYKEPRLNVENIRVKV